MTLAPLLALFSMAGNLQEGRPQLFGTLMRTTDVIKGFNGGAAEADVIVVRTEAQWDKLRAKIGVSDEQNKELMKLHGPLGDLDWRRDQLVFARAGERPTGGFTVSVYQVVTLREPGMWRLDVTVTPPKKGSFNVEMITNPFIVFRMRRVGGQPTYFVHDAKPK